MGRAREESAGDLPGPTPSGLGRLFGRIHDSHDVERAIGNTAKGRRIKAQQARKEGEEKDK